MTITIALGWWIIPAILTLLFLYLVSKSDESAESFLGCLVFFSALGWIWVIYFAVAFFTK
jgi:hypothetical protein